VAIDELARALLGFAVFTAIIWSVSEARRAFPLRYLALGFAYACCFALLLMKVPGITAVFAVIAHGVNGVQTAAMDGAIFVFGYLGGGPQPFPVAPGNAPFIFALQALPSVLLVSALSALLWHWGVLRWIVRGSGWLFGVLFRVSGPVGVSTSACIFLGMVEAPLLIRPLIARLSRGEIFIIMVDGLSVIAGSNMILLGSILSHRMPDAFTQLLTASLISTPLAMGIARAIVPAQDVVKERLTLQTHYKSGLDAMTQGTLNGVKMAVNIAALLIVFVGTMALVNKGLAALPHQGPPLTLNGILGWLFFPVAWLMGVPGHDVQAVAALLGTKVSINEVFAYSQLAAQGTAFAPKSLLITTFALCSFGNVGSVAILIGALTAMAPERAGDIVPLGFRALLAAFLTSCTIGSIAGIIMTII
jgi:CNT family concentrative nucleoside transporter